MEYQLQDETDAGVQRTMRVACRIRGWKDMSSTDILTIWAQLANKTTLVETRAPVPTVLRVTERSRSEWRDAVGDDKAFGSG